MLLPAIQSLQHPLVKYLTSLRKDKSFRRSEKKVVVMGLKMVEELALQKAKIHILLTSEKNLSPPASKETFIVSEEILKKITGLPQPEPMLALVDMPDFQDLGHFSYVVALDGLADPGNLGTLLRSALAFGWEGAYLITPSADPFNDKALRAAKGATFRLPIAQGSFEEFLIFAEKRNNLLADKEGITLSKAPKKTPLTVILSRESQGVRNEAKTRFPRVSIPMSGPMESLNVASAGSILLYHLKDGL